MPYALLPARNHLLVDSTPVDVLLFRPFDLSVTQRLREYFRRAKTSKGFCPELAISVLILVTSVTYVFSDAVGASIPATAISIASALLAVSIFAYFICCYSNWSLIGLLVRQQYVWIIIAVVVVNLAVDIATFESVYSPLFGAFLMVYIIEVIAMDMVA